MKPRGKQVLYGWNHESQEAKIRRMLSLPLAQRHKEGLVTGQLAKLLEKNQRRLYGSKASRRIQVLQLPPR